jgi:hypothetical protein
MKLKEKFTNSIVLAFEYEEKIQKSLVIADDYAIEFAEWFIRSGVQFYDNKSIGNVYTYIGDLEVHTSKELLEIFKKEKGL